MGGMTRTREERVTVCGRYIIISGEATRNKVEDTGWGQMDLFAGAAILDLILRICGDKQALEYRVFTHDLSLETLSAC